MPLSGLMHLARLQGLAVPELLLQVDAATADDMTFDVATFLSGLSGIRFVRITGLTSDHIYALNEAHWGVQELGLPCPASLYVTGMGS